MLSTTSVLDYDSQESDGEAPVMPEFWEVQIILSLPSLPDSFRSGVIALDSVLLIGQIELFDI